ncbi:MAG: metalloprotease [Caulobacterales bacterium]
MSQLQTAVPPTSGSPAPPAQPSPTATLFWGVISTVILFAWIAWQIGWLWAAGMIAGVFVHEFGHVLVINWAGSGPSSVRIIPFLGGAATMRRPPDTDFKGVLIALAGPSFGLLATIPFFLASSMTGDPSWQGGAFFIGALNLINLAPATPLDGSKALGPVLARIHPLLERAALLLVGLAVVAFAISRNSWIVAIFVGLSLLASMRVKRLRAAARPLNLPEWLASFALYGAVVALCAFVTLTAARDSGVIGQMSPLTRFGG